MTDEVVVPKTLIVPLDGSEEAERALGCADILATKLAGADVVLLRADVDDGERGRPYLESIAVGRANVTALECVTGDPVGAIARAVQARPDAVVCMTTRSSSRGAAPFLGSVATEVLRALDGPVLLVGPRCTADWWHEPAQLVVCWCGAGSDAILAPARSWSAALGMDLSLLCVFHPLDVPASVDPAHEFAPARAQLAAHGVDPRVVDLRDDDPSGAITDYARALPASLLALTTHARIGLGRAVLGSAAMDVVHRSPCPVLAVRHRS